MYFIVLIYNSTKVILNVDSNTPTKNDLNFKGEQRSFGVQLESTHLAEEGDYGPLLSYCGGNPKVG